MRLINGWIHRVTAVNQMFRVCSKTFKRFIPTFRDFNIKQQIDAKFTQPSGPLFDFPVKLLLSPTRVANTGVINLRTCNLVQNR